VTPATLLVGGSTLGGDLVETVETELMAMTRTRANRSLRNGNIGEERRWIEVLPMEPAPSEPGAPAEPAQPEPATPEPAR
jgi:hypothetical protein